MDIKELPAEVIAAIQETTKLYNNNHAIEIADKKLKPATHNDYAIFLRQNGYAIIRRESYEKLSKRKREKLIKGCYYVSF